MAVKKSKINYIIPFPDFIIHHDGDKVILVLVGDFKALDSFRVSVNEQYVEGVNGY